MGSDTAHIGTGMTALLHGSSAVLSRSLRFHLPEPQSLHLQPGSPTAGVSIRDCRRDTVSTAWGTLQPSTHGARYLEQTCVNLPGCQAHMPNRSLCTPPLMALNHARLNCLTRSLTPSLHFLLCLPGIHHGRPGSWKMRRAPREGGDSA